MVPYLQHKGAEPCGRSLALCEYCAEIEPDLWPAVTVWRGQPPGPIAAEMHAGFRALRMGDADEPRPGKSAWQAAADVLADIARIEAIWRAARQDHAMFLYSDQFGAADAMYAPCRRPLPVLSCLNLRLIPVPTAMPSASIALMVEWYDAAAREPAEWQLAHYESVS